MGHCARYSVGDVFAIYSKNRKSPELTFYHITDTIFSNFTLKMRLQTVSTEYATHPHSRRPFTMPLDMTLCKRSIWSKYFGITDLGVFAHNCLSVSAGAFSIIMMRKIDPFYSWNAIKSEIALGHDVDIRTLVGICLPPGTRVKIFYGNSWYNGTFSSFDGERFHVQCDCDSQGQLTKTHNPLHIHIIRPSHA